MIRSRRRLFDIVHRTRSKFQATRVRRRKARAKEFRLVSNSIRRGATRATLSFDHYVSMIVAACRIATMLCFERQRDDALLLKLVMMLQYWYKMAPYYSAALPLPGLPFWWYAIRHARLTLYSREWIYSPVQLVPLAPACSSYRSSLVNAAHLRAREPIGTICGSLQP